MAMTMCPAPGQITVILCVRRAATSRPGRIAANLFVRRPEKQVSVIVLLTVTNRFRPLPSIYSGVDQTSVNCVRPIIYPASVRRPKKYVAVTVGGARRIR